MTTATAFQSEHYTTKLAQFISSLLSLAEVPGLGIAVVKDATLVWERGFGVKSIVSKAPVDTETVFEAASMGKPIFAYAVLKLATRGLLDLDRPLEQYSSIPYTEFGFDPQEPQLKLVTARQVLSHSAGFGNWLEGEIGRLNFTPGERFLYSGEGYTYLQRVVEQITGEPLAEYMARHVLEPLGMHESSYVWRERYAREDLAAQGHGYRNVDVGKHWTQGFAAFSLFTTARDYATFLREMMYTGPGDTYRLDADTLHGMITPQIQLANGLSWGSGWGLEETDQGRYFWHWGDPGDYTGFTLGSRERRDGLVILTNSESGLSICSRIVQEIIGGEHPCFAGFLANDYDIL